MTTRSRVDQDFFFGLKVMTGKGDTFVPYKKGHMFLTHTNKGDYEEIELFPWNCP